MSETGGKTANADPRKAESDRRQFELLYQRAFEVRRRLGLKEGLHVFDIDHPVYYRVQICADAYDSMYVLLQSKVEDLATSVRDNPYTFESWHSVSINKSGGLIYGATDLVKYASRWSGVPAETDSELDTDDAKYDLTEPLPDKVSSLIGDMNEILPIVTLEEYNHDESYEDFDEDRYDRGKQKELKDIEEALSTAGGAHYLLQLALLSRYRDTGQTSKRISIPASSSHSIYEIAADHDPEPTDDSSIWHPTLIEASKASLGSFVRTRNGKLKQRRTHLFIDTPFTDIPNGIKYEEEDLLVDGTHEVEIDTFVKEFRPEEELPEDILKLVKHLLKAIVTAPEIEGQ